jgi:outer membrane protein assembly factor BamE (lipoprotein component of BamABCDE complex)
MRAGSVQTSISMNRITTGLIIAAALAASGCARVRGHQGYVADQTLMSSIQPGIDNRASVEKTLGRPTFGGEFDQNDWYYFSRETKQLAFAQPSPAAQSVLHVRFDAAGNVIAVDTRGMEKVASISPVKDKTPTLGRNRSFFSEVFGNIGTVGASGQGGTTADNPDGN